MAGEEYFQGAQPIEYVEETNFATSEDDASWNWIGLITGFSVNEMVEEEIVGYLPDGDTGLDLQTFTAEKVSELHDAEVTYHPQDDTFYQYFTGSDGGTAPDPTSLQFGMQDTQSGEFRRLAGAVGEELSIEISEDSVAEVTGSFIVADVIDDSTTDYVGTGTHSSESTDAPLTYDDLGSIQWGGAALDEAIESLSITVSNDLTVVKDPDATTSSHVSAIVPVDREITVELSVTYDDFSMMRDVRSFLQQDLTFDWPVDTPVSWTINGIAFPEAPYEFAPDDLIADSLSSTPASDISWA